MVVSHDSFCNPQTLLSPLLPFFLLVIHDTSPYFRRDELFAPFHDLSIYSRLWHNNGLKMFYEVVSKLTNCLTENQMEFSKLQILYCFIVVFLKVTDSQKNSTYMMQTSIKWHVPENKKSIFPNFSKIFRVRPTGT